MNNCPVGRSTQVHKIFIEIPSGDSTTFESTLLGTRAILHLCLYLISYSRFFLNLYLIVKFHSWNLWESQLLVSCIKCAINFKFLRHSDFEWIISSGRTDGGQQVWHIQFSETKTGFSLVSKVLCILLCETKTGFWNHSRTWFRWFHCWNVATPTCLLVCESRWNLKNHKKSAISKYLYTVLYSFEDILTSYK